MHVYECTPSPPLPNSDDPECCFKCCEFKVSQKCFLFLSFHFKSPSHKHGLELIPQVMSLHLMGILKFGNLIFFNVDIDECVTGTANCHANAQCANTHGSFTCTCNTGYSGTGISCIGIIIYLFDKNYHLYVCKHKVDVARLIFFVYFSKVFMQESSMKSLQ